MSILTDKPVPFDFYHSFAQACKGSPYDPAKVLDWFFLHGYAIKEPDFFMLACADPERRDAWIVFWAETYPRTTRLSNIRRCLKCMPHWKPYCGWARGFRGRFDVKYYSTNRLLALTKSHR